MAKTKEYSRWAIVGEVGLYCGQHLTRKEAISEHVQMRYGVDRFTFGQGLSTTQLEMWHKCRAKGDRCVKVRIIVPVGNAREPS
jgi:hypothetical protein